MTCIVGLVEGNTVYMGGDCAGVSGYSLQHRTDPKVFRVGEFLIGYTSSFRMGQLLRYKFAPPTPEEGIESHRYMATAFVDAVRACLKDGGYARKNNEEESGGTFLVGFRGKLYEIGGDYQVAELSDLFAACGCGQDIALGAMYASEDMTDPKERIKKALRAAERYSAGVCGPFVIEVLGA